MDYDNDQKLDWMEFETGAYDSYMNYITLESKEDGHVPSEKDLFAKLDLNQDEYVPLFLSSRLFINLLYIFLIHSLRADY